MSAPIGRWDLPSRKEWEAFGFMVPDELCSPEPTLAGPVSTENADTESARPAMPFGSDESRRMEGGDPGRSPQSECKHDMFIYNGESFCHWCGLKLGRSEP